MKTFKQFLTEEQRDIPEIPWEPNEKIGWWKDSPSINLYHGTHIKNLENIKKTGVNVKDRKTGMLSFSLDKNTSHGYASQSGAGSERQFREAGAKVQNTPHNQRVVFKYTVPKHWIDKHIDPRLGGNLNDMSPKMHNKSEYEKHAGTDAEYYGTSEIRLSHPIPHQYITGYMRKVK